MPLNPIRIAGGIVLALLLAPPRAARGAGGGEEPFYLDADTLTHEAAGDTVEASGNVRIRGRGMTLLSDRAFLFGDKEEAEARGNVILMRDGDTLRADRIRLNYRTDTGVVENGAAFMPKGNFHLRAQQMEKRGPDAYRLERGVFTTCDGDNPSWKFSASEIDVNAEGYATGKNALFYVKDVPLLYFPYLIYPVKRERQSGLLTPRTGNSSKKGFMVDLAYYWAISPSQDATFNLDILTKRGTGLGVDYRYIRKRGSEGNLRGFVIYDTEQQRFRGDLSQRHQEIVSDTFNLKSDINLVADRNFYRDYAEESGVYNQSQLETTLSATKYFDRHILSGEFRYVQDLREEVPDNRKTLQKLPTITLTGIRQRLWETPVFFSFDSNFINFYRREGIKGQRLDLSPVLTGYAKPFGPLEAAAWVGYRQRLYYAHGVESGEGIRGSGLFSAGTSLSSTLSRVFETASPTMPRVRHVMTPEIRYNYVQDRDQESLPFFDYNDRIVHENRVVYSLTNYVTGRFDRGDGPPEYRDLLYLRIAQGYEFSGTRRDLLTLVDEKRHFTDVQVEAAVHPHRLVSLSTDLRYNPYRTVLSTVAVSADARDEKGNAAGITYRHARDEVEYLEAKASLALFSPVFATYANRYSFDRKGTLESFYSLEYRHQCWSVSFSYRDRPDTNEFFVTFALAGIGSVGKIRAF